MINPLRKLIPGVLLTAGLLIAQSSAAQVGQIKFNLSVEKKFVACFQVPGGPTPVANVTVTRGGLKDTLVIKGSNFVPHMNFDMFTVQRSNLLSDGTPDPNFTNFGMAWYQSDLHSNSLGELNTTIKTILLDQIFGFDADQSNPNPINTFHVGFWFNDPNDAAPCGFDPTHPTPFNGEHKAGPAAMISVPDPVTNLGPLCTDPNGQGGCNP